MTAARPKDAQYGWEVFKQSAFALSLLEINEHLRSAGLRSVSPRMYQHYHKLARFGYEEYLPINQLDVKTLQNPVWDAAVRNRYAFRDVSIEVELRLIHRKSLLTLQGLATRVSDAILVVKLEGDDAQIVAGKGVKASDQRVEVVFRSTGEILTGNVESFYAETRQDLAVLRVSLSNIGFIETLDIRTTLGLRKLRVVITPQRGDVYLAELVQSLYWILQGLEAARAATDDLLIELDPGDEFTLPATRVERLSLASPLSMDLLAGGPAILLVLVYIRQLVGIRKTYHEGSAARDQSEMNQETARKVAAETRVQEATARRLEWENRQRELGKEVNADPAIEQAQHLIRELLKAEGRTPRRRAIVSDKAANVIATQVIPALNALVEATGDAEISLETDEDVEDRIDSSEP